MFRPAFDGQKCSLGYELVAWLEAYACHGPGDVEGQPLDFRNDPDFEQFIIDAYELNLNEEQLRGAPKRTAEGHDPSFDRDWEEHVHRYYNATPYWGESDPMSTGR